MRVPFAAAALLLLPLAPAFAAPQAGVAAVVVGDVTVSEGERARATAAETGMRMDLGDRISSAERARMQVLLLDQTVFTVGPNSDLVIDKFVYDPAAGVGEVAASYSKGLFRYVSGQVAKLQPQNVNIRTPMGTIGVRGTALFMTEDPEGGGAFIGLLGPGPRNNADAGDGGFTFSNEKGSTTVARPEFGIFVREGVEPGPAVPTPPRLVRLLSERLTAAAPPQAGARQAAGAPEGGGGTEASGQSVAETRTAALVTADSVATSAGLATLATQASQDIENDAAESAASLMQVPQNLFSGRLPFGVAIPFAVQMSWNTTPDLDLHLVGNLVGGMSQFHVFFASTGNFSSLEFAALDADRTGAGGSEVIGISQLNPGSPYTAYVFNFGNSASNGTSLSAASTNLIVSFIKNGMISRGPLGSAIVNGQTQLSVTPTPGSMGNTYLAFTINPATGNATALNQLINTSGGTLPP